MKMRLYKIRTVGNLILLSFIAYSLWKRCTKVIKNERRDLAKMIHELNIQSRMVRENGTGCKIPKTHPFNKEIMQFIKPTPKIKCSGMDWVSCDGSQCYVIENILHTMPSVECNYRDILYVNDYEYFVEDPVTRRGGERYTLTKSDHVRVYCVGNSEFPKRLWYPTWEGIKVGLRNVTHTVPIGQNNGVPINVIVIGFDSVSHNQFLRRLPKSYNILTLILGAVVLNGYNIVGDGTQAALFPMFTGRSELELPDTRKIMKIKRMVDPNDFLFSKLRSYGFTTAYFEDSPKIGTFQERYNGFRFKPADHYLRDFLLEANAMSPNCKFCVGSIPRYVLLMNLTHQFIIQKGKKFGFTLIADITHDDDFLSTADDELADLLTSLREEKLTDDTAIIVMGDHGCRFAELRNSYQGKVEERLPFMAILLPERIKRDRPDAEKSLKANVDVLTTPFDIHTTLLDLIGLKYLSNTYRVPGAGLRRGLSLLEQIPATRSCAEADVPAHWCACLHWVNVSQIAPLYKRVASALADYINYLTADIPECMRRDLERIEWVMTQSLLGIKVESVVMVRIAMSPMQAIFEATAVYVAKVDDFVFSDRDISRIDAYGDQPKCIVATHPHLKKYCYCQ